jgi:hypothetical protein
MPEQDQFYPDYKLPADSEPEAGAKSGSLLDGDFEFPLETRCCITGEEVKHSFCRYPDPTLGTMMVMSHETMLRFSRPGESLSERFERVVKLRRAHEASRQK